MKIKKFEVPYYKWRVICMLVDNYADKEAVTKKMRTLHMRDESVKEIENQFDTKCHGGATIYYNSGTLEIVILVMPHFSVLELVSTLVHEGRHAADHVIESVGLEGDEASAYLTQHIIVELIKDYIYEANTSQR